MQIWADALSLFTLRIEICELREHNVCYTTRVTTRWSYRAPCKEAWEVQKSDKPPADHRKPQDTTIQPEITTWDQFWSDLTTTAPSIDILLMDEVTVVFPASTSEHERHESIKRCEKVLHQVDEACTFVMRSPSISSLVAVRRIPVNFQAEGLATDSHVPTMFSHLCFRLSAEALATGAPSQDELYFLKSIVQNPYAAMTTFKSLGIESLRQS